MKSCPSSCTHFEMRHKTNKIRTKSRTINNIKESMCIVARRPLCDSPVCMLRFEPQIIIDERHASGIQQPNGQRYDSSNTIINCIMKRAAGILTKFHSWFCVCFATWHALSCMVTMKRSSLRLCFSFIRKHAADRPIKIVGLENSVVRASVKLLHKNRFNRRQYCHIARWIVIDKFDKSAHQFGRLPADSSMDLQKMKHPFWLQPYIFLLECEQKKDTKRKHISV